MTDYLVMTNMYDTNMLYTSMSYNKQMELLTKKGHSPTLESIKMVEDVLKNNTEFPSKSALLRALPKTMQTQTFNRILKYLEESQKIIFTKDTGIVWVFSSDPNLRKVWEESVSL